MISGNCSCIWFSVSTEMFIQSSNCLTVSPAEFKIHAVNIFSPVLSLFIVLHRLNIVSLSSVHTCELRGVLINIVMSSSIVSGIS